MPVVPTGRVAHESRIAPRNRRSSSSPRLLTSWRQGCIGLGSVVGDEHGDAAGGEVGHVRAGGLALGRLHGSAEHLLRRVAELGDQVKGGCEPSSDAQWRYVKLSSPGTFWTRGTCVDV